MRKYIKTFKSHTQYETFINGGGDTPFVRPNVSHCIAENEVHYKPRTWADEYLTFDIVTPGTIVWSTTDEQNVKTISYSINNGEWTDITPSTTGVSFNVSVGDKVRFKGNNTAYGASTSSYNTFNGSTASFNVQGNIMSLTNGDLFANATTFESDYVFVYLFNNADIINAKNLVLPVTTLTFSCYQFMFYGCTALTTAPELPAETLASYCYEGMFNGCTALTTAPELPATTLADNCYSSMFHGCTSLVTAPELPVTTLASHCYQSMFNGCTNLVNAPVLPATTLASWCYCLMFYGCTNIKTAPELPATTLADNCYYNMFYDCAKLETAPQLPTTTLASACYTGMFIGCTSLKTAPTLPATTLTDNCYYYMFKGCTNLNYIKCLATDISASDCLSDWVSGVASTGTFVKAASMTSWTTGTSGIPSGWTVVPE